MTKARTQDQQTAEDAYETAMMRIDAFTERIMATLATPPTGVINWGHVGSLNAAIDSLEVVALVVEQAAR